MKAARWAVPLTLILSSLAQAVEPGQLAENQSRFGAIEGDVGFLPQGGKSWQIAQVGLPFEPGDHIRTADNSRVELQMTHDVLWILEPESEAIVEFANDHAGRLDLLGGTLFGTVDTSGGLKAQHWELTTPAATIVIHGTQFVLQFSPKDGARLGVFQGEVDFQAAETAAGESPTMRIAAKQEVHATRGKASPKIESFSPDMKVLAARQGELRRRQATAEEGWAFMNPDDRKALRKKYVAAPPKARATKARVFRRRDEKKKDAIGLPGL
jgi:hypothetical protein